MPSRVTAIMSTLFLVVSPSLSRAQTTDRDADIQRRIAALESQLAELKALVDQKPQAALPQEVTADDRTYLDYLHDLKFGAALDTYYGFNFNRPIGRVNVLRAYDVTSNNFSLNQANLIVESAPDLAAHRRFGGRLDFQFGQATETLQGSLANEPRPYVYRNIFQAYGSYILPVGSGLTVDFGKWASALGTESNYSKDQLNYSRSYWFDFLPFYHMGARVNYRFTDAVAIDYWITNGTQQTEAFNNFKDQFVGAVLTPTKKLSWNVQYYLGQEHPDVQPIVNPGTPNPATQPGLSVAPVVPYYTGKLKIFDTYATWTASADTAFTLEGDYVSNQNPPPAPQSRAYGGAVYARQQLTKRTSIAGRAEYLRDHGGLFTGASQAIKETTVTYDYRPVTEGFLIRAEWRRDFSNIPFFLTDTVGNLKTEQQTATLGVVWWWGTKPGAW